MIQQPPVTVASADRHVVDQDTYQDYGHDLTNHLNAGETVSTVTVEAIPPAAVDLLDGAAVVDDTQIVAWAQANADVVLAFHAVTSGGREQTFFTALVVTPRS